MHAPPQAFPFLEPVQCCVPQPDGDPLLQGRGTCNTYILCGSWIIIRAASAVARSRSFRVMGLGRVTRWRTTCLRCGIRNAAPASRSTHRQEPAACEWPRRHRGECRRLRRADRPAAQNSCATSASSRVLVRCSCYLSGCCLSGSGCVYAGSDSWDCNPKPKPRLIKT